MNKDNLSVCGTLSYVLFNKNGECIDSGTTTNGVTNVGLNQIVSRLKDASAGVVTHVAVGTDNTAFSVAQTALGAEVGRVATASTTVLANKITWVANFPAGTGTGSLNEVGLFNAGVAGDMYNRALFALTINKGPSDTLQVTWDLTVSN